MNFKKNIDKYQKILINKVSILLKSESYNSLHVKKNRELYKKKVNISATAIFSEKKPYLTYSKDIKRRKSIVIDFKGGEGSVYSEIAPIFNVKL